MANCEHHSRQFAAERLNRLARRDDAFKTWLAEEGHRATTIVGLG
jgi:hypothetical protein